MNLRFEHELLPDGESGELFVRYRPVVTVGCLGEGSLSFASWDVAVGAPLSQHEATKQAARQNVLDVLRRMIEELS